MAEKSSQKFTITSDKRLKLVYKLNGQVSNIEKQVQVENQKRGNKNIVIQTKQNEDQINGYQTLLQQIEDLLDKNLEKYKSQIEDNADQLLNRYWNLEWLMNIAFGKKQQELKKWLNQEKNIEQQNKQILENQQKKDLQGIRKKYEEEIAAKTEETRKLNQIILQLNEKQKEIIQQKENQKNKMDIEIEHLTSNLEALKQQIKTKDKIFQETLKETKKMSAEALEKFSISSEFSTIKNSDDKLKPILKQEEEIRLQTKNLSGDMDEMLIITQQNSQNEKNQEKMQKIQKQFQSLKDQITTVIKSLEKYILKQKQIWGSAKQVDSQLNQQVKQNLEFMMTYSKLFENLFQTFLKILEKSNEYLIESNVVQIERKNENINHNFSTFIQHIYPKSETQKFYASIETQSNDTISRKESESQTEYDNSQDFQGNSQFTPQLTQSSSKKKNKKKPCQKQIGQSIFSNREFK